MNKRLQHCLPISFEKDIIIIVGGYGSGKSEVAVNLSRHLAGSQSKPVTIADLDIVNPYFRSREAARQLEDLGVRSIHPPGAQAYADLPIILPEIRGAIEHNQGLLILDIGGDDVGARVLSSLADAFVEDGYEMLLVLNRNRPFTADVKASRKMMADIEHSSRLKFTGIISNSHLMDDTTEDIVREGLEMAQAVQKESGLPIALVSATPDIAHKLNIDLPLLALDRWLLKPWERPAE